MSENEPESYDIQTMMERLKSRSHGDEIEKGELVTRSDGSQAIRVRKRKRRTQQPHKDRQRRVRIMQVTAGLVLVVLLVVAFGCITVYVNSPPFRSGVVDRIGSSTGAGVVLHQFRMNPSGANASGLDLSWPEGNVLEGVSLRQARADVSPMSFFSGGSLTGEAFQAASGVVVLRLPQAGSPVTACPMSQDRLPMDFAQYGIKDLTVQMKVDGAVLAALNHVEASYTAPEQGHAAQLILTKGELVVRNWPKLDFDRGHIEFRGGQAEIIGMRLIREDDADGLIELSGTLDPYVTGEPSVLRVRAESFRVETILGDEFARLFSGRMDSVADQPGECRVAFGGGAELSMILPFAGLPTRSMQLKNLPFLFGLSQTLGDEWFANPEFTHDAKGVIVRSAQEIGLSRLELASKGRMVVKGSLLRDGSGGLRGKLEVGVAPGMIIAAENQALERMFSPERDGYRWIEIEVGGTLAKPTDDFSRLYEQALQEVRNEPAVGSGSSVPTFDELTRPR